MKFIPHTHTYKKCMHFYFIVGFVILGFLNRHSTVTCMLRNVLHLCFWNRTFMFKNPNVSLWPMSIYKAYTDIF